MIILRPLYLPARKQCHQYGPGWSCEWKAGDSFKYLCTKYRTTPLPRVSVHFTGSINLQMRSYLWLACRKLRSINSWAFEIQTTTDQSAGRILQKCTDWNISLAVELSLFEITSNLQAVENVHLNLLLMKFKLLHFKAQVESLWQWADIANVIGNKKIEEYWMRMIGTSCYLDLKVTLWKH